MAAFEVGDWVGAKHHRWHQPGRITDELTLKELDGEVKPLYRIDFQRFTLHLTAEEIWKSGPPEPGVTYGPPERLRKRRTRTLTYDVLADEDEDVLDTADEQE